jgi:PAS domain S-box-containing protein
MARRQERASDALAAEVDYYRRLFDRAPEPYIVTDSRGVIRDANDAAAALFGISRRLLRGKPLPTLLAIGDRAPFRARLLDLLCGREPAEWDARVLRPAGPELHVSVLAQMEPTFGTSPSSISFMLRDLTASRAVELEARTLNAELERRVAERTAELAEANHRNERLLAQEKRARRHLAALLDRLEHGVIVVDRALDVEFANRAADELLGGSGLQAGTALPEPFRDFSLRDFAAQLFEGDDAVTEFPVGQADGGRVYSLGGIPAEGSGTAVVLISDISERERRERAQRDFITNAAHELQTPLTAIASATEVLQSGAKELPAQRDRFLAHIEREAGRLARLTRGLLVLARAQALGENPRAEPVNVADVLEATRRELASDSGIEVEVACDGDVSVVATRELLEQALRELVTNALKHTQRGTIMLAAAQERENVVITVSDTGSGFAGAERERVLDRFYRADGGQGEGFGLGLSIVHQIVGALGGEIAITSEPGEGTAARMILRSAGTRSS